jgi:hypothetical protein
MGVTQNNTARAEPTVKRSLLTTLTFALILVAWVG